MRMADVFQGLNFSSRPGYGRIRLAPARARTLRSQPCRTLGGRRGPCAGDCRGRGADCAGGCSSSAAGLPSGPEGTCRPSSRYDPRSSGAAGRSPFCCRSVGGPWMYRPTTDRQATREFSTDCSPARDDSHQARRSARRLGLLFRDEASSLAAQRLRRNAWRLCSFKFTSNRSTSWITRSICVSRIAN